MEIKKQIIYLDNNATTKVDKRVLDAMMPFLTNEFANANSTHQFGLVAYEAVKVPKQTKLFLPAVLQKQLILQ